MIPRVSLLKKGEHSQQTFSPGWIAGIEKRSTLFADIVKHEDGHVRHSATKMADKNNGGQVTPEADKSAKGTADKSVRK